ncbi:MAG TPA: spore coat protein CotJB [Candidatus Pullilachnospira intestinigallinarum]|nr:spore coat protein CotJB [Candidatus Pullilachnospira intestinigallinarum]
MNQERIAMITMPVQRWTARYTKEEALKRGTIFRELDLPFFAERPQTAPQGTASGIMGEQEDLRLKLDQVSFALDDLTLYLDTHPAEPDASRMRQELIRERKELVRILEDRGDSLTKDGGGNWRKGPMPWEGVCG